MGTGNWWRRVVTVTMVRALLFSSGNNPTSLLGSMGRLGNSGNHCKLSGDGFMFENFLEYFLSTLYMPILHI